MTTIKLKNGSGAPTAGDLAQGEPALDLTNKRLYTEDSGGTVIEVGTNPGEDVTFADNRKAIFGAGSDLQIYHDGANSFISDTGTGNLILRGSSVVALQGANGENGIIVSENGAVDLRYDNSTKLDTTATGIDVTGSVTAEDLIADTTRPEIFLKHEGTQLGGLRADALSKLELKTTASYPIFIQTNGTNVANFAVGGDVSFYNSSGTSQSLFWDASAERLGLGTSSPTQSLHVDGQTRFFDSDGTSSTYSFEANHFTSLEIIGDKDASSGGPYTNAVVTSGSNGDLSLRTNGTDRLNITQAGNVSINSGNLDVTGSVTADGLTVDSTLATINSSGPNVDLVLTEGSTNTDARIRNSNGILEIDADLNNEFGNSSMVFAVDGTDKLKINNNGDISFYEDTGTTAKLFWDASTERLELSNLKLYSDNVRNENGILYIGTSGNYATQFYNNDANTVHISGAGNVGIGTSSPSVRLDTRLGTTTGKVAEFHNSAGYGIGFTVESDGGVNTINSESNQALAFATNGASNERMRIDASGNLLVGKTTTTFGTAGIALRGTVADFTRDGNVPINVNRLTNDGDLVKFHKDGVAVGSIGANGGRPYFASGGCGVKLGGSDFTPVTSAGATSDNVVNLGSATARFKDIYATNGTIQTSDRNEKQDIEALSDAEQRVAVAAKGLLQKFRWIDSVEEKGDDARIHFGIIAQDLQDAFTAEGLDAGRYAMFINSTWTDEETGEERSRMGVRYSELLAFIIAAI